MGAKYPALVRDEMYKQNRTHPLPSKQEEFGPAMMQLEKTWHKRDEATVTAAMRALSVEPATGARRASQASTQGQHADTCLGQAMKKCTQKCCKRSHECPFCNGKVCNHAEGFLEWHLGELRTPRKNSREAPGTAGAWKNERRSRSRNRDGGSREWSNRGSDWSNRSNRVKEENLSPERDSDRRRRR